MKQDSKIDIETDTDDEEKDYEAMRDEVVIWIFMEVGLLMLGEFAYSYLAFARHAERVMLCSGWVIGKRAYVMLSICSKFIMMLFVCSDQLTIEEIRGVRSFMLKLLLWLVYGWILVIFTYPIRRLMPIGVYDLIWGDNVYQVAINNNE